MRVLTEERYSQTWWFLTGGPPHSLKLNAYTLPVFRPQRVFDAIAPRENALVGFPPRARLIRVNCRLVALGALDLPFLVRKTRKSYSDFHVRSS